MLACAHSFTYLHLACHAQPNHLHLVCDAHMLSIIILSLVLQVITGTDALKRLFNEVGLGWITKVTELPLFAAIVDVLYNFLSANRLRCVCFCVCIHLH